VSRLVNSDTCPRPTTQLLGGSAEDVSADSTGPVAADFKVYSWDVGTRHY
jgi:hypothetical protein